jgi:hypothetical protein
LVLVANEITVFTARSQFRPRKPIGFSGRDPWRTRMEKAIAIWATLSNKAAKKYSFQPIVWAASTPVSL